MKTNTFLPSYQDVENGLYPDDFFSYPHDYHLDNFSHMASVGLSEDIREISDGFEINELHLKNDGCKYYTEWTVCPKTDIFSSVNVSVFLYRIPNRITLLCEGISEKDVFYLDISTQGWKRVPEYTGKRIAFSPSECKNGQIVFEVRDSFTKADLHLPICDIAVRVRFSESIKKTIKLYDIIADFETLPYFVKTEMPDNVQAGENFKFRAWNIPECHVFGFELSYGRYTFFRQRFNRIDETIIATVSLPKWLPENSYTVFFLCDGVRLDYSETITVKNSFNPGFPLAEKINHNGRPYVFIDGKPFPWIGYSSYDYVPGSVSDFGESGINLFCIPVACGQHIHAHISRPTILREGTYDYNEIDERVCFSLQSNPDGKILLRTNLLLPRDWIEKHVGCEPLIYYNGKLLKWAETSGVTDISLMCDDWLRDQKTELDMLIKYCASRPWADRLIGIMLSGEVTEEWFAWAANNEGMYSDYSSHCAEKFKKWLLSHNRSELVGLSPLTIPLPSQRRFSGEKFKPDSSEGLLAASYSEFLNEYTSKVICYFADAVKEASDGRLLAGSLYGYAIQLAGDDRQSSAGHMGIEKFISHESIDFLCGIPWLNYRDTVDGYDAFVSVLGSIQKHGKLVLNENDSFSVFHPFIWHKYYNGYKENDKTGGASLMHRSTFAYDFIHGNLRQYFSLMATWHYSGEMQNLFKEFAVLQQKYYSKLNLEDKSEIAFLIDDASYAFAEESSKYTLETVSKTLRAAGRNGAPIETYLLSDIDILPKRIKTVIITNALAPTESTIEKIRKALANRNRRYVLIGELGLFDRKKEKYSGDFIKEALAINPEMICFYGGVDKPEPFGEIFKKAGVHFISGAKSYCYASEDAVSVTYGEEGKYPLDFGENVIAEDVFTGEKKIGKKSEWRFEKGQTRLFVLEHL